MRTPLTLIFFLLTGCLQVEPPQDAPVDQPDGVEQEGLPVYSVALSEYPSWSAVMYAHDVGLVNAKQGGAMGTIETERGIDLVFKFVGYDKCLEMYGAGDVDAVAMTNIDSLPISIALQSVGVFPTSTSDMADTVQVTSDIKAWDDLRGVEIYGLANTVSEYNFRRVAEVAGQNPDDFNYVNMDPDMAAMKMIQGEADAISVWNPFKRNVVNAMGEGVHELGNSGVIPLEILDLMVASQASLDRPEGDAFVAALMDAFYGVNTLMADPATRTETLEGIAAVFAPLSLEDMEIVVTETKFFSAPQDGLALYTGDELKVAMEPVVKFAIEHGTPSELVVGYGTKAEAPDAHFRYDPSYMQKAAK